MRVSILFYTYRPGSIDILCDSLKHQTHTDYELIIVDDYIDPKTGLSRKKVVDEYLNKNGIYPAYNGPSKKPCFPELAYKALNSINTGLLMSTGDPIIILTDYIWMHPTAIEQFCAFEDKYKEKTCITSIGKMYEKEPYDLFNPISVWKQEWDGHPLNNGAKYLYTWTPEKFELSFAALPWSVIEATNGWPEALDCMTSYTEAQLNDFFFFHEKIGAKYYVAKDIVCEMINHRDWMPLEVWHATKQIPKGSTELVWRPNCFDLKTHKRGTLP